MHSKITSKFQTTVPRAIREKLKLSVADAIEWRLEGDRVYIEPVVKPLLAFKGIIAVGAGSTTEDIARARQIRAERFK